MRLYQSDVQLIRAAHAQDELILSDLNFYMPLPMQFCRFYFAIGLALSEFGDHIGRTLQPSWPLIFRLAGCLVPLFANV
jgi:hypothetical protein